MIERSLDHAELRALLKAAKSASGLSYETLAERAHVSRGTAQNYVTEPDAPARGDGAILAALLDALAVSAADRARALQLHGRLHGGSTVADAARTAWRSRARAAGFVVWTMAEFTPSEATVHTAIGHRAGRDDRLSTPPPYVRRDYDQALRTDVSAVVAGELSALILLRGTSSTGKTRSLFEAVHALCPDHVVVRPRTAAALVALPGSDLLDRPVVVWLNELQGFLGPNGTGLSRELLRELFERAGTPPVVVGTIWPAKSRFLADGADDRTSETRELLTQHNQWVRCHDIPATFSAGERAVARQAARSDPRVATALADRDRVGFTQTLAGAHELLDSYRTAPRLARLVLEAAADARRLGVQDALSQPLLAGLTVALWRAEHGSVRPPADGVDTALTFLTTPIRSEDGVRALVPLDDVDTGELRGYTLADYLEQHLTRQRAIRPVTDGEWAALTRYVPRSDELLTLARQAEQRLRLPQTEALLRASGPPGLGRLATWLSARPGREPEAEAALVDAAAAGAPDFLPVFRKWFRGGPREHEAEAVLRAAAATGGRQALRNLTSWFGQTAGHEHQAEPVIHQAAANGDTYQLLELADWLRAQPGREDEAEAAYRNAAAAGERAAYIDLADMLSRQPGREHEAEAAFRDAAAAGQTSALLMLTRWLSNQPGRERDAEAAYRETLATYRQAARPYDLTDLAGWLQVQPGRQHEAELIYREAAAAGDSGAAHRLASWLCRTPGREPEGAAVYRDCAASGDPGALSLLAQWLRGQPGREREAEATYREAAAAGDKFALRALAAWLGQHAGREQDIETIYREAAAADGPHILVELAEWLREQPGREHEAEAVCREAATNGDPSALTTLARWLRRQPGRARDAETAYREAAAAGESSFSGLTDWLRTRPGREADVRAIERYGLDAFGANAQPES